MLKYIKMHRFGRKRGDRKRNLIAHKTNALKRVKWKQKSNSDISMY